MTAALSLAGFVAYEQADSLRPRRRRAAPVRSSLLNDNVLKRVCNVIFYFM
jgi:hypothetical protein